MMDQIPASIIGMVHILMWLSHADVVKVPCEPKLSAISNRFPLMHTNQKSLLTLQIIKVSYFKNALPSNDYFLILYITLFGYYSLSRFTKAVAIKGVATVFTTLPAFIKSVVGNLIACGQRNE